MAFALTYTDIDALVESLGSASKHVHLAAQLLVRLLGDDDIKQVQNTNTCQQLYHIFIFVIRYYSHWNRLVVFFGQRTNRFHTNDVVRSVNQRSLIKLHESEVHFACIYVARLNSYTSQDVDSKIHITIFKSPFI